MMVNQGFWLKKFSEILFTSLNINRTTTEFIFKETNKLMFNAVILIQTNNNDDII